jgi:CheY-like chemotaxis protein
LATSFAEAARSKGLELCCVAEDEPEIMQGSILLVEDNPVNQDITVEMLSPTGVSIAVAGNGLVGVDMYIEGRFDVILMDCQMLEMNSFATAACIRELERRENRDAVPIVALTANALDGDKERCLAAGAEGYLSKPFSTK